jgi:hypothetical protein
LQYQQGGADQWGIYSGISFIRGGTSDTSPHIIACLFNGSLSQFWVDGSSIANGNAGSAVLDGLTLGSNHQSAQFWKGYIGPILIYPGNLSTADKNQVGEYLASVTGISWSTIT